MHWGSSAKKRLLSGGVKAAVSLVLLVLIFSPVGQIFLTPVAQADTPAQGSYGPAYTTTSATAGANGDVNKNNNDSIDCGLFSHWDVCITNIVYVFTVSLGTGVAYIGANIFSIAVKLSLSSTAYGLDFITQGWSKVRDIANMFFIFILVYIAVMIILSADTGHTMQTLAFVIFIALIINFSFFFTRVVIDAGNIMALQFYNAIQPTMSQAGQTTNTGAAVNAVVSGITGQSGSTKDLTAGIMQAVQVQSILNNPSFQSFYKNDPGGFLGNIIALSFVYISVGAILFILAAAFLTAGVKFLVRMVMLWFMIIISPLALVAKTMHQFEHHYNDWQTSLIKHTFYPVVFLFVFWVLTQLVGALGGGGGSVITATFNDVNQLCSSQSTSALGCIGTIVAVIGIRLGFVIVMLYIGLKAAEEMGVAGAKAAQNIGNKFSYGAVGFLGRNSFGRLGLGLNRSSTLKSAGYDDEGKKLTGAGSALARTLQRTGGILSRRTFDPRNTPGLKGVLKDVGLGEAKGKGGIAKYVNDKEHNREKAMEDLSKEIKGDTKDVRREQAAFIQRYDAQNGTGAHSRTVKQIADRIKAQQKTVLEATEAAAKAANTPGMHAAEDRLKNEKKRLEGVQHELHALEGVGKSIVDARDKERVAVLAKKLISRNISNIWMPSRASIKAGEHLLHGESKEKKAAKAFKELIDEGGGGAGEGNQGGASGGARTQAPRGGGHNVPGEDGHAPAGGGNTPGH